MEGEAQDMWNTETPVAETANNKLWFSEIPQKTALSAHFIWTWVELLILELYNNKYKFLNHSVVIWKQ